MPIRNWFKSKEKKEREIQNAFEAEMKSKGKSKHTIYGKYYQDYDTTGWYTNEEWREVQEQESRAREEEAKRRAEHAKLEEEQRVSREQKRKEEDINYCRKLLATVDAPKGANATPAGGRRKTRRKRRSTRSKRSSA